MKQLQTIVKVGLLGFALTLVPGIIVTEIIVSGVVHAENNPTQQFSSGPEKTTLIELYTSQGCSSCPPAEKYLNSLKQHSQLWKKYIPLALHVDYWDYIGWKDRFASPDNTLRQRQYAQVNAQRSIYTPGFFVNGKPWRRNFYNRHPDTKHGKSGVLKINLQGNKLQASFNPVSASNAPLVLNVAIAGMGFKTEIEAGEREGSHTMHDFILLNRTQHKSTDLNWHVQLPKIDKKGASQLALIAWVSQQGDPRPLQTLGGYIN
jgi:hypothetical protein